MTAKPRAPRKPSTPDRADPSELSRFGADGDTITIQLLVSIAGFGEEYDVLTVIQTPLIDVLLARNWAAIYTGPTPPGSLAVAVSTGAQTLTLTQQQQVEANLHAGLAGIYVPQPGPGDATGSVPTKQSDGSIAYAASSATDTTARAAANAAIGIAFIF